MVSVICGEKCFFFLREFGISKLFELVFERNETSLTVENTK